MKTTMPKQRQHNQIIKRQRISGFHTHVDHNSSVCNCQLIQTETLKRTHSNQSAKQKSKQHNTTQHNTLTQSHVEETVVFTSESHSIAVSEFNVMFLHSSQQCVGCRQQGFGVAIHGRKGEQGRWVGVCRGAPTSLLSIKSHQSAVVARLVSGGGCRTPSWKLRR